MSQVAATINGVSFTGQIEDNQWLLDFLRDDLSLHGAKRSCDVQVCGACTVLVDGQPVSSCCFLAVDIDGSQVETIEGVVGTDFYEEVANEFMKYAAVQCGFCTPGFVLTLKSLRGAPEVIDEGDLRRCLRGNLCRCTGYRAILDAAMKVLDLS